MIYRFMFKIRRVYSSMMRRSLHFMIGVVTTFVKRIFVVQEKNAKPENFSNSEHHAYSHQRGIIKTILKQQSTKTLTFKLARSLTF